MAKLITLEKLNDEPDYMFYCPGCKCHHGVWTTISNGNKAIWSFNNDIDKPTFSPSILVRHSLNTVCHSFIKDGFIQYLNDCTHEYAGKTIELDDI